MNATEALNLPFLNGSHEFLTEYIPTYSKSTYILYHCITKFQNIIISRTIREIILMVKLAVVPRSALIS